jgi:hypothetical protein
MSPIHSERKIIPHTEILSMPVFGFENRMKVNKIINSAFIIYSVVKKLNYQQLIVSSSTLYFAFTYRQNANVESNELRTGEHDALFSPGLGLLCSGMLVGFSLSASNWNKQNEVKQSFANWRKMFEVSSFSFAFESQLRIC